MRKTRLGLKRTFSGHLATPARFIRGKTMSLRLRSSAPFISGAPTPLCNYHLLFRAAYCGGHAWLCRASGRGDGRTWLPYSWLSLPLPYCLITPRSSSFSYLGGIFSVHSVGGSVQPSRARLNSARSPGAEIVRILAPIFSEQIALVRSTTLRYGAAPSTSPTKGNNRLFRKSNTLYVYP